MGKEQITVENLQALAKANGYNHGAHQEKNTIRDTKNYSSNTLKDQDRALKLYERQVVL